MCYSLFINIRRKAHVYVYIYMYVYSRLVHVSLATSVVPGVFPFVEYAPVSHILNDRAGFFEIIFPSLHPPFLPLPTVLLHCKSQVFIFYAHQKTKIVNVKIKPFMFGLCVYN